MPNTPININIDPANLKTSPYDETKLLAQIFKNAARNKVRFGTKEIFTVNITDPNDSSRTLEVNIKLTNPILKRKRTKGKKGFRYEALSNQKYFDRGLVGKIREIVATLKIQNDRAIASKYKKSRLVKKIKLLNDSFYTLKDANHEAEMMSKVKYLHAKPKVVNQKNTAVYFVMKKLQRMNLEDFLLSYGHRLTLRQRYELSIRLLDALDKVHQVGMIHRDIKPENIFYNPATGDVYILDFGISKNRLDNDEGKGIGNLAYISPEQLNSQNTTEKADLYSLGKVFVRIWNGDINENPLTDPSVFSNLFNGIAIPPLHKTAITACISNMTSTIPDNRKSIPELKSDLRQMSPPITLAELLERLNKAKSDYQNPSQDISKLKFAVLTKLEAYLQKNFYSDKNELPKDASRFEKKQLDCSHLLNAIQFTTTSDQLISAIYKISRRFEAGFFDRNELRDVMLMVLNNHLYHFMINTINSQLNEENSTTELSRKKLQLFNAIKIYLTTESLDNNTQDLAAFYKKLQNSKDILKIITSAYDLNNMDTELRHYFYSNEKTHSADKENIPNRLLSDMSETQPLLVPNANKIRDRAGCYFFNKIREVLCPFDVEKYADKLMNWHATLADDEYEDNEMTLLKVESILGQSIIEVLDGKMGIELGL